MLVAPDGRVVPLQPEDAWSLLPSNGLGRVLYTNCALPAVRLLPFALHDRVMVIALDAPSLQQLRNVIGSVTTVEIDDPQRGWTVTITGAVCEDATVSDQDLAQDPELSRWLDGTPATYIRIEPAVVHGLQCAG